MGHALRDGPGPEHDFECLGGIVLPLKGRNSSLAAAKPVRVNPKTVQPSPPTAHHRSRETQRSKSSGRMFLSVQQLP
jgi:hypothetical protein